MQKFMRTRCPDGGFILPSTLVLVILVSLVAGGMVYLVTTEMRMATTDLEHTQSYYGAEAAMEKMIADLSALYVSKQAPTVSDIQALGALAPSFQHIEYPEYEFHVPNSAGTPESVVRNIGSGPNEGLIAEIFPLQLSVTARADRGTEVRMIRDIEVALIPVFQFGVFSDGDLSYFPGPGFDFAGRVHTNGDLYLATGASSGLTFRSRVSAAGEVIRAELANGLSTIATGRDKPVYIPTAPSGCDGERPACRDLQVSEGSVVGGPASAENPDWPHISQTIYNGMVVNGKTGARALELPFVESDLTAVEVIRRPQLDDASNPLLSHSRLYTQAQIRVLLSDSLSEHPNMAGVRLANTDDYWPHVESGTRTAFAEAVPGETGFVPRPEEDDPWPVKADTTGSWPLIDGYLLVEARMSDGSYLDVTEEFLGLGIAREDPDAVLIFQTRKTDALGVPYPVESALETYADFRKNPERFLPINLYDAREGEMRDEGADLAETTCAIGGIVNVAEVNVNNLRRWLHGETGLSGTSVEYNTQNGYLLYFSDRRGMLPGPNGTKTGEYGFEDVVNPNDPAGLPNALLDEAEDVNGNGMLDVWGRENLGDGFLVSAQGGDTDYDDPTTRVGCLDVARQNRVSGARRALKLVNGGLGNLPRRPDGTGGFTIGSENPVYVQGNYNASTSEFDGDAAAAAIMADSVTLLSGQWTDLASFQSPIYLDDLLNRQASESYYRMAVAAGKGQAWDNPSWASSEEYGLDGGTHNFLRYLENWSGRTLHYRGSLVSLYFSQYATGIYKCCDKVFKPPTQAYSFDTNFLELEKLPPGTPRFRDIVSLGYQQVFTPGVD